MSNRFSFDSVAPVKINFDDIPSRPSEQAPKPSDLRSADEDVRDGALSSGGSSSSAETAAPLPSQVSRGSGADANAGESPAAAQVLQGRAVPEADSIPPIPNRVDNNVVRRPVERKPNGSGSVDDTSVVRLPASLAKGALDVMEDIAFNRSDAVAAILCSVLGDGVAAPEKIRELVPYVPKTAGEDAGLRGEVSKLRDELAAMTQLLHKMNTALLETQSIAVWLLGERLGSPGTQDMQQQNLTIAFSDAELIRSRVASQTQLREVEMETRRGREIEDERFRKSQRRN